MEDKYFKFGQVNYPLEVSDNLPIEDIDPVLNRMINVFMNEINSNLQDRWDIETAKAKVDYPNPVAQSIPVDPMPFVRTDYMNFPLLAVFPTTSLYNGDSLHLYHIERSFQLLYIMDPLQSSQAERMYPFLRAIECVLAKRIISGVDANEQPIWGDLDIQKVILESAQHGKTLDHTGNLFFPSLSMTFKVLEQVGDGEGNFEEFEGADVAIDEVTNDGPIYTDFITAKIGE